MPEPTPRFESPQAAEAEAGTGLVRANSLRLPAGGARDALRARKRARLEEVAAAARASGAPDARAIAREVRGLTGALPDADNGEPAS